MTFWAGDLAEATLGSTLPNATRESAVIRRGFVGQHESTVVALFTPSSRVTEATMEQKPDRVRRTCRKNPPTTMIALYINRQRRRQPSVVWVSPMRSTPMSALLIELGSAHPFLPVEATERANRPKVVCAIRWGEMDRQTSEEHPSSVLHGGETTVPCISIPASRATRANDSRHLEVLAARDRSTHRSGDADFSCFRTCWHACDDFSGFVGFTSLSCRRRSPRLSMADFHQTVSAPRGVARGNPQESVTTSRPHDRPNRELS